jgi:SAM-dependent methyltransferase
MDTSPEEPWYLAFFRGDYRAFWHPQGDDDPDRDAREAEGVVALLGLQPGEKVLDLCCGQGRHCVELARRGMDVTGLDLSGSLLAEARRRVEDAGLRAGLVQADMREILFQAEFDAAINMFTAFGYLESDAEDLKALRAVRAALRPGGRFLLDARNFDGVSSRPGSFQHWVEAEDGGFCLTAHELRLHPRAWVVKTIVLDGADRREYEMHMRAYTADEMERMFGEAGFPHFEVYGDWDGGELTSASGRLICVGRT